MFPFWELVTAPVLEAAGVRRVVEIGALRGENTELMLERLGPDVELHVIDPVPDFDPQEHERRFAGRYVFHRDLSLNVLGHLPPMDAALVDGDHNWYTVYNELRLLREVARAAGAPMPVLILHDVCWPYGRRDLYYAPENIPEEFRKTWRRTGMLPQHKRLVPYGAGLNPTMCNAEVEGGRRNGVMTGLDDFMAEHDRPLRRVVLPIYFGLAIVAEEERLARQPELAAQLDRLESPEGKDQLLELAEETRLSALIFQHSIYFQRDRAIGRIAERYLDSIKRGLIDEYYLENELRVAQLAEYAEKGTPPDINRLRDPVRRDAEAFRRLRELRRSGTDTSSGPPPAAGYAFSPLGRVALDQLHGCLDTIRNEQISGDLADCGVGRGGAGIFLRAYLEAHDLPDRQLWVADRFRAAADDRLAPDRADGLADLRSDLNLVRDGFDRFALLDDRTHFLQGDLDATLPGAPIDTLALLHIGPGLGARAPAALEHLYARLVPGGFVVIDDLTEDDVREAVTAFRAEHGITALEQGLGATGTSWRKVEPLGSPALQPRAPESGRSHAPLAQPVAAGVCDLSVIVVFYNMRREAVRSLHALSRVYQQGVDALDYEVIVVENGSSPDQLLGEAFVRSFGPEFRYIDLGEDATPSPANALNRGIRASRGTSLALMIDGAHVLTPGVLMYGIAGLATYAPAIVATQPWYVGPGQQGDVMRLGYDETFEDRLFEEIEWPRDGYRLFDIGHFVHDRDWFDGVWESNCLFAPRKLLEQVGGFDEGFAMAGGGYTNLEVFERLGSSPDVKVVSILGEGSFHQVHGGTTTNLSDPTERRDRVFSYGQHYAELRGRAFSGPEKPIHYVGGFHIESAKRSRGRRMTAKAFAVDSVKEGLDGPVSKPVPMPGDLRDAFVAAYWRTRSWTQTSWLGHTVPNAPTDLVAYQEIVTDVGPDWIIETGTGDGGRALFLASICDILGRGQIVSIDSRPGDDLPPHPRVTYLRGRAHTDEVVRQVRAIVGPEPRGLVILGTRGAGMRMRQEFDAYKPFVAVGSYAIMEHTVLNGYPVDASFGPGPHEAVRRILQLDGDFVADSEREKHSLTFNPAGFLQRIR
jgi:cephalosporin hydroxylase/glycosyltransferase involved in cell wall biosynthesis